jgi:thiamine pyrophosphokinase
LIEFILVSGGDINIELLSSYLKNKEYRIMAIDKGIEALSMINVKPDYILGDFDSVDKSIYESYIEKYPDAEVAKYNAEKDYTDTELGIRTALKNGASSITIFGGTGTRLDHTIANIRTLNIALEQGVFAQIIDNNNRIYLAQNNLSLYKDKLFGNYISILPYENSLQKVTLKGFKYDLDNVIMLYGASTGISNEIISDEASITCDNGIFIIIESRD